MLRKKVLTNFNKNIKTCWHVKIIIFHDKVNLKETNDFNPNLGGGGVILPTCWFSLNNSETAKAVTLAFCSIE